MSWAFVWGPGAGLTVGIVAGAVGCWLANRGTANRGTARRATARRTRGGPLHPGTVDELLASLSRRGLNALRAGVLVLDPADEPVLVNPAARMLGLLRAGSDLGRPVAHPIVRTLAGQVRRTGVGREAELDLPRGADADPDDAVGVQLRAVALGGGYVAVEAADVTDAHRVARVRRDFVANVSHELKTPIGALQLLSEALLDATEGERPSVTGGDGRAAAVRELAGAADPAAARRFAERIHRESARLGQLVTELIELSRLQGADPLPRPEPVPVDWLVAEVVDRTRTAAMAKRIDVGYEGARGLTVYGSDSQLATAVANLVENAIAYSADGSQVTVAARADADGVAIAVVDEGMGIAGHELDRVFERFYRADRARSRETGGTGLGLAIVKHIATNHGGRVEVASTVGTGSTFTLRLPVRPLEAALPLSGSVEIFAEPATSKGTG